MNNLIIGANSFLGKEICKQLLIKKNEIVAVYNKNTDNLLENIRSISIKEMFLQSNNYDIIYIVSAYIPKINDDNIEEKLQNANVNLVSKICQKFPNSKIIYCSSVSVYKVTDDVIYEKSETNPDSLYGKSKLQGEEIVKMQKKHSIVRIASMFGIGMKESTFLPAIINCAIKTKKIHLIGNGSRLQNYISVKDVANYLIESSKSNNNKPSLNSLYVAANSLFVNSIVSL